MTTVLDAPIIETSPQYQENENRQEKQSAKKQFHQFSKNDENEDSTGKYQGKSEDKKKKKKKNKNKKKGKQDAESQEKDQNSLSVKAKKKGTSVFDKTQSTVGNGSGDPFSARTLREEANRDRDFTPLKDKLGQSFFEDADSSEDEGMPDYKIGGYHPVHVGEILLDRYVIIQKLGWGHFSTVWLTKDLKFGNYVAMKVQKSAQHYLEAAYDEVEILDQVAANWRTKDWKMSIDEFYGNDPQLKANLEKVGMSGNTSHCVQLLNSFIHHGPNGKHFVMVFEILGVNFLEIIKRYDYKGVPIPLVRKLAKQCLIGLDYLHRMCKIIHTDFKPENVVITLRDDEVAEIAKTGQLTTSKLFDKGEHIKRINQKLAGALIQPVVISTAGDQAEKDNNGLANMEGLTAKQKKNRKKKLQKQRRKAAGDDTSKMDGESEMDQEQEKVMTEISSQVQQKKDATVQQKKRHTKKGSIGEEKQITGLLMDDDEEPVQEEKEGKKNKRGPKIDENVQVKICDMGNGCWTYHHFTPEIQTRQYRSPEVIIGADYDTSADIWSFACTIFEMVTGDFLFEPRKGSNYDKDDDHLAQMMELLGRMPKNMALSGKHSKKFFDAQGHLKRISGLNYWPLKKVLMEKYRVKEEEAVAFAEFLVPMLTWYPDGRATAQKMLSHPWLTRKANYEYKYSDREYEVMMLKKDLKDKVKGGKHREQNLDDSVQEMNELLESDEELNAADCENSKAYQDTESFEGDEEDDYDSDEASLWGSDDERVEKRKLKDKQAKINNSFTGPYPLDPTDYNHTDKGPNSQFEMF